MSGDPAGRWIDKQAIAEALYRYARGWDRREAALLHGAFHPDATIRLGGEARPAHALLDDWLVLLAPVVAMTHLIHNILIGIGPADADPARCESHFTAHHRRPATGAEPATDRFVKGRYLDRFERRGEGAWRIASRIQVVELDHTLAALGGIDDGRDDAAVRAFYAGLAG